MRTILAAALVLLISLAFVSVVLPANSAHATATPALCDSTPKYYCSRVQFTRVTGGYTISAYEHRGAIDGGADQWRRYYVRESAWPSGTFLYNVPTTGWKTNQSLPATYTSVSRNVTYFQHINVHFGFQYYECIPGQCYYWWGDTDQIMLAS